MEKEYMTTAEAAAFLHVSERTIRRMVAERRIPFYPKLGRGVLFVKNEIVQEQERRRVPSLSELEAKTASAYAMRAARVTRR